MYCKCSNINGKSLIKISVLLAIIITGGKTGFTDEKGVDTDRVQLLDTNGTLICNLPNLPDKRFGHTQNGLVACGGGNYSYILSNCLTFQNGSWTETYNLAEPRFLHSSWSSPDGIMLFGGMMDATNENYDPPVTSEILMEEGGKQSFSMKYRT